MKRNSFTFLNLSFLNNSLLMIMQTTDSRVKNAAATKERDKRDSPQNPNTDSIPSSLAISLMGMLKTKQRGWRDGSVV